MDLKKILEQKKAEAQAKKAKSNSNGEWSSNSAGKYKRRAEFEAEREKQYLEEAKKEKQEREQRKRARLEDEKKARSTYLAKSDQESDSSPKTGLEEGAKSPRDGTSTTSPPSQTTAIDGTSTSDAPQQPPADVPKPSVELKVPKAEVVSRLRAMRQPITLFGESDGDRLARLQKLEAMQGETIEGQRNDLRDALREAEKIKMFASVETGQEEEGKKSGGGGGRRESEEDLEVAFPVNEDVGQRTREEHITHFLIHLLKEWEADVRQRTESQRRTQQSKLDEGFLLQSSKYLKPLFRQLIQKKPVPLPEDILDPLFLIVKCLKAREYVRANDHYLNLAIGNAPWPMGVTMVGIHERSGREKIENSKVAHILNDENQRKYIQSVKRLITFCQKKYPTDPSRMATS